MEAAESLTRARKEARQREGQRDNSPLFWLSPPSLVHPAQGHPLEVDMLFFKSHFIQNLDCLLDAYDARIVGV